LLHVLPEDMPRKLRSRVEERAWLKLTQLASSAAKVAKTLGNPQLVITPDVTYGQAYIEIIRNARTSGADLVLVGRHGGRGVRDLLIGTTAMRVIRKGDIPVLIVTRKPARTYLRPLVAIDLEDTSRGVLELARVVADSALASIPVIHAYWPPFESAVLETLTPKELPEYHRGFKRKADSDLRKILASCSDPGIDWKAVVRRGDPRSVVLEEAAHRRSDLIVVGTHARSGLSHALLGSVAECVIRRARCDVLVARPSRFSFRLP
jgi:nucleotide-binding universal stress UspA family protein